MNDSQDLTIQEAGKIFLKHYGQHERPSWDEWGLIMAKITSTRSPDPSTKHGCVIVDKDHRIISTGYNGPAQCIDNSKVPTKRPEKYLWMIHAETNALFFADRSVEEATVYVTGRPCSKCISNLLQNKVSRIVYGPQGSKCVDDIDVKAGDEMIHLANVSFEYLYLSVLEE